VRRLLLAFLLLPTLACKTAGSALSGDVEFSDDAETNLKRGNDALENKNYQEAERYFEFVKGKYPFLDVAKTAELRLGDTAFDREQFTEARDQFLNFIKLHPAHPKVDYAAYKVALSHYKEIPSDFFLLPPSEEKDQIEVKAALKAMAEFVRQYPKSQYVTDAGKVTDDCKRRLVQHELYVARFYFKRERWNAVVARMEGVLTDYAGIPLNGDAAWLLHDAYENLKNPVKGKAALRRLIDRFPGSDAAARAHKLLGS
jgi:outer membrane protein assembly factor BamD